MISDNSNPESYAGWAWVEPFHVAAALVSARVDRLFRAMRDLEIRALLLTKPESIRYITNFPVKGYRPFIEIEYACVLPLDGPPSLVYSSGADKARLERYGFGVRFTELSARGWSAAMEELLRQTGVSSGRVGVDLLPFELADQLRQLLPGLALIPFSDHWARITAVKLPAEVEILRHAVVAVADLGMRAAVEAAKPGVTELEVSARAECMMRLAGSEVNPFIPVVASGANASFYERIPTYKQVAIGELVVVDVGCVYRGYTAEYARTICIGKPTAEQMRVWRAVNTAVERAIAIMRPGVVCAEVDRAARQALEEAGYGSYQHRWPTGHQLGFGLHGSPLITASSDAIIEAGMVMNVEPGVILVDQPEVGGVTIEESVLITTDGPVLLTKAPRSLNWD